ncbi:MAG: 4Fe-4S dicluster domain-containing protein [Candidatus Krumholzibacteria bacterium]|nr:4Fe-4S dicluster domain-containing protein [Candidatus Krumholzibacteria bacterium]
MGPTLRDQAIVYDEIESTKDLPAGWTDEQDGGKYRVKKRDDDALFGYVVGPQSWKKYLFPPRVRLFAATRSEAGFEIDDIEAAPPKYAFIGVRPCELHAIAIQDRVFLGGEFVDPNYKDRRDGIFTVAVNCGEAGGTCFCDSMNTGPRAKTGYDLALTEIVDGDKHYFLVESGSDAGKEIAAELPLRDAAPDEKKAGDEATQRAISQMGRRMETAGLKELLYDQYRHLHWHEVAERCLTCGNCTMVCPTCFCTNVEDTNDLSGDHAERWRVWDSCFTSGFTYIHGGQVRRTAKARYRQWMTHKLGTWQDQFGVLGCVGCGRCITWCPVGIDITEEVHAIRTNGKD